MTGVILSDEEVNNILNEQDKEIKSLKKENEQLKKAERKVNELTELLMNETKKNAVLLEEINSLRIENMRLKKCRNISVILE